MFDGILFDLDGTLWDAVPQVAESWNLSLERLGVRRPPVTQEELRPYMGMLLEDIAGKILPGESAERQRQVIMACCEDENAYLARRGAALYPREEEVLALLSQRYPLFVVSNCQTGYIEAFYAGTGLGKYFTDYESAGNTGRPKSENIALVAARNGLKNPVYVGDTALDYRSAREAGVPFIHAAYGFGTVEGVPAIHSPEELPALLARLEAE